MEGEQVRQVTAVSHKVRTLRNDKRTRSKRMETQEKRNTCGNIETQNKSKHKYTDIHIKHSNAQTVHNKFITIHHPLITWQRRGETGQGSQTSKQNPGKENIAANITY